MSAVLVFTNYRLTQVPAMRRPKTSAPKKGRAGGRARLLQVVVARLDELVLVLAGAVLPRGHQRVAQALACQDAAHHRQRAVDLRRTESAIQS